MTKKKQQRQFAFVAVSIFGMIFLAVTFLRYVPPVLFRTFIKSLTPPQPPPDKLFSGYVLSPIPTSVTNIKADQPSKFFGSIYTFRFYIRRDDLALLLDSRPFIEIWNVKYKNGILGWDWSNTDPTELNIPTHGYSLSLYGNNRDSPCEPKWFKPELWDNPEAYAYYKVGYLVNTQVFEHNDRDLDGRETIQILLYNEKEGEAYFIVSIHENK